MITNNYNTLKSDLYKLHRKTEDGVVNSTWKKSERPHSWRIFIQSTLKKSSARDIGKGVPKGKDTYKGMKCNHVFTTSKAGAQRIYREVVEDEDNKVGKGQITNDSARLRHLDINLKLWGDAKRE